MGRMKVHSLLYRDTSSAWELTEISQLFIIVLAYLVSTIDLLLKYVYRCDNYTDTVAQKLNSMQKNFNLMQHGLWYA